jgi:hypothetical protein
VSEDLADDVSYDPWSGDWWINVQAASVGSGTYITASDFEVSNETWQLTIRDSSGQVVFGPVGEGIQPVSGIGSDEVFKLESDPSRYIHPHSNYNDGSSSTFGAANVYAAGTLVQDFSVLRTLSTCVSDEDCDDGNPCTTDTCDALNDCVYESVSNGTPCPDGDFCDGEETCEEGVCTAGAAPCQDACEQCDAGTSSCRWCLFDLDRDTWIAPGDFSFFAGCYGGCYGAQDPCAEANFDASPDGCVGPGDFSGFAGCYGQMCSECNNCFGVP